MTQETSCHRLKILPVNATFEEFISKRDALAWLSMTKPETCASANILSQITPTTFNSTHIQQLNKLTKHVHKYSKRGITHHPLDMDSVRMITFSDSSFANNSDKKTQLGYIVLLTDKTGKSNILHYASYKSR